MKKEYTNFDPHKTKQLKRSSAMYLRGLHSIGSGIYSEYLALKNHKNGEAQRPFEEDGDCIYALFPPHLNPSDPSPSQPVSFSFTQLFHCYK